MKLNQKVAMLSILALAGITLTGCVKKEEAPVINQDTTVPIEWTTEGVIAETPVEDSSMPSEWTVVDMDNTEGEKPMVSEENSMANEENSMTNEETQALEEDVKAMEWKTLDEVKAMGVDYRIAEEDGVAKELTADYKADRYNLVVKDGKVEKAFKG